MSVIVNVTTWQFIYAADDQWRQTHCLELVITDHGGHFEQPFKAQWCQMVTSTGK